MTQAQTLTTGQIRAAKAFGKLYWLCDEGRGSVPGLRLAVTPASSKSWSVRYTRDGRRKSVPLGAWPAVSLRLARELALKVHREVAEGCDPARERLRKRTEMCVADLAERVHREHYRAKKKPSTARAVRQLIDQRIVPGLGALKLSELTTSDIAAWHAHAGETTPGAANRALAALSKMCTCAVRWALLETNPCRGIERFQENSRERYLTVAEYRRLLRALRWAREHGFYEVGVSAIEFIIYTALRASDVTTLRWACVNFERDQLELPDSKTGFIRIPLNTHARAILERQRRVSDWVFPGGTNGIGEGTHINSVWPWWTPIRKEAGLTDVRVHDLRHAFASVAAQNGESLLMIGKLLGHKTTQSTARYAHLSPDGQKAAADSVARSIAALSEVDE